MGLTHLDAGVVIGVLDAGDAHHAAARAALAARLADGDRLAISSSALAECLVGPFRRGDDAVAIVDGFVASLPISIVPIDAAIARSAAMLRARHPSMRLPDALVVAVASGDAADRVITTDRRWPPASSLGVDVSIEHV